MSFPVQPGYWMFETSGVLRPAVEAYLQSTQEMTPEHIAAVRAYLRQWMAAGWVGSNVDRLRAEVDAIKDRGTLSAWIESAMEDGIEPL
jgi:hypothetical protein